MPRPKPRPSDAVDREPPPTPQTRPESKAWGKQIVLGGRQTLPLRPRPTAGEETGAAAGRGREPLVGVLWGTRRAGPGHAAETPGEFGCRWVR